MSISSFSSFRLVESIHKKKFSLLMSCYDHLCDALTVVHGEVFV